MALDAVRGRREIPSVILAGLSVAIAMVAFPGAQLIAALAIFTLSLVARFFWQRRARGAGPVAEEDQPDA